MPNQPLFEEAGDATKGAENRADSGAFLDGRGWFRTSDLSRVKLDQAVQPVAVLTNCGYEVPGCRADESAELATIAAFVVTVAESQGLSEYDEPLP